MHFNGITREERIAEYSPQNCELSMRRECRERFPRHRLQRKPLVRDHGMHHGPCVTRVPRCMSGSLNRGGGENAPDFHGACATCKFTYLVRDPPSPTRSTSASTAKYPRRKDIDGLSDKLRSPAHRTSASNDYPCVVEAFTNLFHQALAWYPIKSGRWTRRNGALKIAQIREI